MTPSSQQKRIQAIEVLKSHIEKDKSMQLVMAELVAMHKAFLAKVADLQNTIDTKVGPEGPMPTDDALLALIKPLISKIVVGQVISAVTPIVQKIKPIDGKTPTDEDILRVAKPLIDSMELPYDEGDIQDMIDAKLPTINTDEIAQIASDKISGEIIVKKIPKKSLTVDHINGLTELFDGLKKQINNRGQYLHGAGVPSLAAGSGISLVQRSDGGYTVVNTGATSIPISSTETPNGVITIFTFPSATAQPTFIISDNAQTRATSKSGTVNWTWNNSTKQVTMIIPPTDDIVAIP